MSKNENKDPLDKILTIGQNVIVGTFLLLSIYIFFIVPTYPKIDKSLPFNVINIKIKSQIEQNISQVSLEYANDKKIPFVALLGEKEIEEGVIVLKNMISGEQTSLTIEQIIDLLSK